MALGFVTGTATCMEKFCGGKAVGWKRDTHTWLYVRGIKDSYISKYPSIKIDIHTDSHISISNDIII